jgi:hypothetical protein
MTIADVIYLARRRFLHSEAFYAVAQKKYVFIYDQDGVEVQYVLSPWSDVSYVRES